MVKNRKNVTIEGQGATFFAKSNGVVTAPKGCVQQASTCRYPNRTRSQLSFESDTNLVVRDVNVVGSNSHSGPNGDYNGSLEAQHAFQILGGRDILLDHVSGQNVWGDLVNVGAAPNGSLRSPTNVTVQNSSFHGASRQGWSITNGQHVTFANNTLASVRRSLIDVEANVKSDQIAFVTIRDNQLGSYRFCTFTNFGAPADEHDFVFSGNHSIGAIPIRICGEAASVGPPPQFPDHRQRGRDRLGHSERTDGVARPTSTMSSSGATCSSSRNRGPLAVASTDHRRRRSRGRAPRGS